MTEKLKFTIKGMQFSTETATIGRLIDYYKFRSIISGGTYGMLFREALRTTDSVIQMIECEAFFQAFCPKFLDSLIPKKFQDLGIQDYSEIKQVYDATIKPWIQSLEEALQPEKKEESADSDQ